MAKQNKEALEDIRYVRRADRRIAKGKLRLCSEKELREVLRGA